MMRKLFIVLMTFLFTAVQAQQNEAGECYINKSNSKINRRTYPFKNAAKILLVKYNPVVAQGKPGFFIQDNIDVIPIKDKKVDTTKFSKSVRLTKNGIDSLIIIANSQSNSDNSSQGIYTDPSTAIIFINRKGKVFEYIVVCFTETSDTINYTEISGTKKLLLGKWCAAKGKMLLHFFQQRGIDIAPTQWNK